MKIRDWFLVLILFAVVMASVTYRYIELRELNSDVLSELLRIEDKCINCGQQPLQNSIQSLTEIEYINMGEFTISHYCTCEKCCGKSNGITASGTIATPQRTVAVDPSVIPLGTLLYIDGIYYVAEDTGGAIKGKKIDICVATHEAALNAGVKRAEVFAVVLKTI